MFRNVFIAQDFKSFIHTHTHTPTVLFAFPFSTLDNKFALSKTIAVEGFNRDFQATNRLTSKISLKFIRLIKKQQQPN